MFVNRIEYRTFLTYVNGLSWKQYIKLFFMLLTFLVILVDFERNSFHFSLFINADNYKKKKVSAL